jgi:4-amino-4-deoxychorismate lyase
VIQQNAIYQQNFLKDKLLLETIKCEEGKIFQLSYHQQRFDESRKSLFGDIDTLDLSTLITPPKEGLFRCRILYHIQIHSIEYIPYQIKTITSLKIVPSDIEYHFKYANRESLNSLCALHPDVDDILIEKEGYLRDTSIANIAFFTGEEWHTPKNPLLYGTMRDYYIDQGLLHPKDIKKEQLHRYTQVALMNAMIGFKIINPITIYDSKDTHVKYHFPNP